MCARPIRIEINFSAVVSSSHLSAPLSLNFCSTVETVAGQNRLLVDPELWRLAYKWLELWHQYFVWGFKYDSTLLQIYLEGRISKKFFNFNLFLEIYEPLSSSGSMACFQTFSSHIYFVLLVSLSARNQVKTNNFKHIMMTKYNKSRILRYFIIFISFWKRFEHKRKIPYIYYINQM